MPKKKKRKAKPNKTRDSVPKSSNQSMLAT